MEKPAGIEPTISGENSGALPLSQSLVRSLRRGSVRRTGKAACAGGIQELQPSCSRRPMDRGERLYAAIMADAREFDAPRDQPKRCYSRAVSRSFCA